MPITPSPAPINPGTAGGPAFAPSNPTGQLAQAMPGFDPTPIINAQEQVLSDYLNQPVHDILAKLGLPALPNGAPPQRLGEAMRALKRRALLEDLLMPLCVVAYGDADWRLVREVAGG